LLIYVLTARANHHSYRECRGDSSRIHPAGENLTTRHTCRLDGPPRMTTFHNDLVGPIRVPPLPSARLPRDITCRASCIHGWPVHYPGIHHCRNGEGSSDLYDDQTTRLIGPHKSNMRQYCSMLVQGAKPTRALIDTGGGYHLDHPRIKHLIPRPSHSRIPLSPSCPARSQHLMQHFVH